MKKIIAFISLFFMFSNTVFGTFGDILYVKKNSVKVYTEGNYTSNTIATLNEGYVVLDQGTTGKEWIKVKLSDGKKGYILNNDVELNDFSEYEIHGNFGEILTMSILKKLPSKLSGQAGVVFKGDKFQILNLNYINKKWMKVKLLDGKSKGKIGYLKREISEVYCSYESKNNSLLSLFPDNAYTDIDNLSNVIIPGINDNNKVDLDDFMKTNQTTIKYFCNRIDYTRLGLFEKFEKKDIKITNDEINDSINHEEDFLNFLLEEETDEELELKSAEEKSDNNKESNLEIDNELKTPNEDQVIESNNEDDNNIITQPSDENNEEEFFDMLNEIFAE